ncbi:MAG: TrkH family potassium uptake protein [Oscillospiraceae bacterium]|nr:TrkH family potassium uptake protein [Oscillospiraceae bacterium]
MNGRRICSILGLVLLAEGAFMLPALLISLFCGEGASARAFALCMVLLFVVGFPLSWVRAEKQEMLARGGLVATGLTWLLLTLFGALPFWLSGAIPSFVDCLFETASGFTTTGASILNEIESLPRGVLYWRSFTNWLGGMGVLVFLLVLSPLSERNSGGGMHILRAESPGIHATKLVPRMHSSASILYIIYIVLTALEFLFLLCGGVPVFTAVTLSLSTAGTGGFTIMNDSVMSCSAYVQWVVTTFMFLFGVNFSIYFLLLIRQAGRAVKNEELRIYVTLTGVAAALLLWNTWGSYASVEESVRTALLQTVSFLTTTGFVSANYDLWPTVSKVILLLLMFVGGCAGSTAGGIKVVRISLMFKTARRSVYRMFHPNAVRLIHTDGELVDEETVSATSAWLLLYFIIIAAAMLLISRDGFSLETNFGAALTCMSNIGPGFGEIGATGNFSGFSTFSKLVLALTMLIGRLEIYPILVLFFPSVWKR